MQESPRGNTVIDLIVLHSPEGASTAADLYAYLQGIDGGYHSLDDDMQEIIAAPDNVIVWGAGGVNERSLHICFVPGFAAWNRSQWLVHISAIQRGALDVPPRGVGCTGFRWCISLPRKSRQGTKGFAPTGT